MKEKLLICCNLCNMQFPCDESSSNRMKRHTDFHQFAQIQKRNTTHGIPKYSINIDLVKQHGHIF
jgi:hypothetical protein